MCVCVLPGEVRWQQPHPPGLQSSLPVLSVPDLDGDKVSDVALVASDSMQVNNQILTAHNVVSKRKSCIPKTRSSNIDFEFYTLKNVRVASQG